MAIHVDREDAETLPLNLVGPMILFFLVTPANALKVWRSAKKMMENQRLVMLTTVQVTHVVRVALAKISPRMVAPRGPMSASAMRVTNCRRLTKRKLAGVQCVGLFQPRLTW
jgi:hypothetical protein